MLPIVNLLGHRVPRSPMVKCQGRHGSGDVQHDHTELALCPHLQALQGAGQIIAEIRETHLW